MKNHKLLWLFLAFSLLAIAAAQKPNLSGTWKLDPLRSRFDAIPAPKSGVLKIEHQEPKLHLTVEMEARTAPARRIWT